MGPWEQAWGQGGHKWIHGSQPIWPRGEFWAQGKILSPKKRWGWGAWSVLRALGWPWPSRTQARFPAPAGQLLEHVTSVPGSDTFLWPAGHLSTHGTHTDKQARDRQSLNKVRVMKEERHLLVYTPADKHSWTLYTPKSVV